MGAGSAVSCGRRVTVGDVVGMRRWRLALFSLLPGGGTCCDFGQRHHALAWSALIAHSHPGTSTGTCCRGSQWPSDDSRKGSQRNRTANVLQVPTLTFKKPDHMSYVCTCMLVDVDVHFGESSHLQNWNLSVLSHCTTGPILVCSLSVSEWCFVGMMFTRLITGGRLPYHCCPHSSLL